ncbi:MAG: hypothetical protein SVT56_13195 [Chloroflexota bacterium]|nr:hypothetical protein [Chloroflexota bacterium]
MNKLQKDFINCLPDETADHLMVTFATRKMREKLAEKRKEGRGGWFHDDCSEEHLINLLNDHIAKGDMVDILNFAAMILAKRELESNGQ